MRTGLQPVIILVTKLPIIILLFGLHGIILRPLSIILLITIQRLNITVAIF